MKTSYLLLLIITLIPRIALAQQPDTIKAQLKKKYESTDLYKETDKKMQSDNLYPDSIVLAPLHFVNTYVIIDTTKFEFESISVDVDIQTAIPDDYKLYVSTFNGSALDGTGQVSTKNNRLLRQRRLGRRFY